MERKFFIELTQGGKTIDYLCAIKRDARATTLRYLEGITEEELDWQPHDGWNSVGALAQHIIALDNFFRIKFIDRRSFSAEEKIKWIPRLEMGKYLPKLKGRKAENLITELKEAHEAIVKATRTLNEEQLFERIPKAYDETTGSDLAWILYHSAEDEVHHRGQISIIRKLYKVVSLPTTV